MIWYFRGEPDKDWPCSYISHGVESRETIWKTIEKMIWYFRGEPDKDWPYSYVSHGIESRIT